MPTALPSEDVDAITNSSKNHKIAQISPSTSDIEKQQQQQQIITNSPTQSTTTTTSAFKRLGLLDRFLALWIFLVMLIGILLGNFVEDTGPALQKGKFVGVSIPIAIGLLVMMYPILCKVKFETLHRVFVTKEIWKQIMFSVVVNWIIAPLLMLGLSWAFLPDKKGLREGLILVGLARCIAMVLIWTGLAGGDNEYCAILVALNSLLQMILYAPLALLFISIISKDQPNQGTQQHKTNEVSYTTVAKSVSVFLGIPLLAAILTRITLLKLSTPKFYNQTFLHWISPFSLLGLLFTILVLFASQGRQVIHQIISVLRVSAPLIVYFGIIFFVTLGACRKFGYGYGISCTQSFTAASNNFELAIAVAVSAYGVDSDQALAATVGPLIEVPVLLGLVFVCRWVGGRSGWRD